MARVAALASMHVRGEKGNQESSMPPKNLCEGLRGTVGSSVSGALPFRRSMTPHACWNTVKVTHPVALVAGCPIAPSTLPRGRMALNAPPPLGWRPPVPFCFRPFHLPPPVIAVPGALSFCTFQNAHIRRPLDHLTRQTYSFSPTRTLSLLVQLPPWHPPQGGMPASCLPSGQSGDL
jgi:hypothetical protein